MEKVKRLLALIILLVISLSLPSCLFPEEFEAKIDIKKNGQYSLTYDGILTHVLAKMAEVEQGKLTAKDEMEIKKVEKKFLEDSHFKKVQYIGHGQFKVLYKRQGMLISPIHFLDSEIKIVSIIPTKDNKVEIKAMKLTKKDLAELTKLKMKMDGVVKVSTDAKVVKCNAKSAPKLFGMFGSYEWQIRSPQDPAPHMILQIQGRDQARGKATKEIPKHINQLVFEDPKFANPVTIAVPKEDDSDFFKGMQPKLVRGHFYDRDLIPQLFLTVGNNSYRTLNTNVKLLVDNGFAHFETITVTNKFGTKEERFLIYENSLNPHIFATRDDYFDPSLLLNAASRKLKSIDYINQYKQPQTGRRFYELAFSYTIRNNFPGTPEIKKTYHGEAKAYRESDNDRWRLDSLKLGDEWNDLKKAIELQYGKLDIERFVHKKKPRTHASKRAKKPSETGRNISYTSIMNKAKKSYHQGKFLETIHLLEDIEGKSQEDVNQLLAKAYINHAYYESRKGRIDAEEQMALYKKAHKASPNQPQASYNLACLYAKKGQKEEAIKWLEISYPILTEPEHSNLIEAIKRDPDLNILREYPGFDAKFPELAGGGYGDDQPSTDY